MNDIWDGPPTGGKMTDSPKQIPEPVPAAEQSAEQVSPQVRLAPSEKAHTFTIPDLGGITIGKQWHEVTADQLERIQAASSASRIQLETKGG